MSFSEKISQYRKAKNMKQDELAEILGVTPQAVSKWETGASMPDVSILPALAKALDCSIDSLFEIEPKPEVEIVPLEKRKPIEQMYLRIIMQDGGDKIKVNLPMALIMIGIEAGISLEGMTSINGHDLSQINLEKIISLVEQGMVGRIVEVEGSDGETLFVEVV